MKDKPPVGYNWISNLKETHNCNSFWKENSRHISWPVEGAVSQDNYVNKSRKKSQRTAVKVESMSFHGKSTDGEVSFVLIGSPFSIWKH